MSKTLAAHTDLMPNYPAFISVSETETGEISVTVRGRAKLSQVSGAQAEIRLPVTEFLRVFTDALNNYGLNKHIKG